MAWMLTLCHNPMVGERIVRTEPDDVLFAIRLKQEERANHRFTIVSQQRTGDESPDTRAGKGRFVVCIIVEPGLSLARFVERVNDVEISFF
jgi:hypothetical protein